ncbi:MAG: sorbosone dehydrogenase family protein [Cyclobacteriaceae bacterium]|nr:sorbosone dehydrogenase family protein [Cyclobacteriaceae bacterium]
MKRIFRMFSLVLLAGFGFCASSGDNNEVSAIAPADLPLERIKLPEGFKISVYAEVPLARSMALAPDGTLFVGSRSGKNIHAVRDTNGDMKGDQVIKIGEGMNTPNGVAFKDGDLYVAEIDRILKYPSILSKLENPGKPEVVFDGYPSDKHHGWKYIAFGPDGLLYVPVGAPCNICEKDNKVYASITRLDVKTKKMEVYASGVRNSVGFTWEPKTNALWFTDNGRDMLGDDIPSCELNKAEKPGLHFGFPYCHEGSIKDPEFGDKYPCSKFVAPQQKLGAHVAPLGLKFYTGSMFPAEYKNQIIVAEHGSWNRSKKSGYQLSLVNIKNGKATGKTTFASGWLNNDDQTNFGRPVDVLQMPDGSLLVSDDYAGVIYRITYKK